MRNTQRRKQKKQKQKKKTFKIPLSSISRCHPSQKSTTKCLPSSVYESIRRTAGTIVPSPSNLYSTFGCKEGEDHCLLDQSPLSDEEKKRLRKEYLRPRMPKAWLSDPDMWLDNVNISQVMKQYEVSFPWFSFLGVFPIDFSAPDPYRTNGVKQCLYKETCSISLQKEYDKGIRGIGMVFNLDPHYKGGSHWVALYIDLKDIKKPFIGYFDSYGYKTPEMIERLMKSFRLQIPSCQLGYNGRRFQFGGSECGMFSMYFLICMIHGIHFRDFCKDAVHDDAMLQLRTILFSR